MKLKILLSGINEDLILRIPKGILEKSEPRKMNLSTIIEIKMQFLLNAIYTICADDIKEQEKRRKLIRLYTKETNELVKILTLLLASKYGPEINILESKILKLQQYNKEQEELADMLVYKCSDLKIEASSSYDVVRAINVLLYGKDNFPTEIKSLATALTTKDTVPKQYGRVDQLLHLHIQKSGIWQSKDVSYTVKNGIVELLSYGFKSTLTMIKRSESDYAWHIISIKRMEDERKSISIKGIVFKNTVKEIVDMCKYAYSVVKIEKIYKIFKAKAESRIFDLVVNGVSKDFTVEILDTYMLHISIFSDWNGPGIICNEKHGGVSAFFKKDIIESVFAHIEKCLREDFSPHIQISLERGIFYKDKPMHTLREIQKEVEMEKASQKIAISGGILKSKVNIMYNGAIVSLNALIRTNEEVFLGLQWNEQQNVLRLFYGTFQMRSLLTAEAIPLIFLPSSSKLQSPSLSEEHVSSQGTGAAHTSTPTNTDEFRSPPAQNMFSSGIWAETSYRPKMVIAQIFEKTPHFLAAIRAYNAVKSIRGMETKISIEKKIEMHVFGAVTIRMEGAGKNKLHATVTSNRVSIEGKISPTEIEKITWIATIAEGIESEKAVLLPRMFRKICVSGYLANSSLQEKELFFSLDRMKIVVSYTKGTIVCTSRHPLAAAWARSAISEKSMAGFLGVFMHQNVIMYPRLISTLSIHNVLGGSLSKTCNSSIVYTIGKYIEVFWMNRSEKITEALEHIPKMKETETQARISLEHAEMFLDTVSILLSNERVRRMGNTVKISTSKSHASVYRLEIREGILSCQKIEGIGIKNAELILEMGPDPEKDLLEYFFNYFPNTF